MKKIELPVDRNAMRVKTNQYFNQRRSCAQSTLLGICLTTECSDMNEKELLKLSAGFGGGMGNTYDEGPCGALVSGIITIGMMFDETNKCAELSRELYHKFKQTYGSPQCVHVMKTMRDHACIGCCHTVTDKIAEMFNRELPEYWEKKEARENCQ